ncbi:sensor histidine kinase [Paenibacillus sp. MMS18-CY102]|uniref:sensor histidine kinase n=1 Tax=Paenibacillus sp. MMS18-CY102 TaxID=2682849 RepID=UPI001365CB4C|nr:sensor histidine kinase [Paenibacillus sp. MMS18-CY102]
MRSLKVRMAWSYLILIVLVSGLLGSIFIALIWNYYYGSATSAVSRRAESDLAVHGRMMGMQMARERVVYMMGNLKGDSYRIQLLDPNGKPVMDTDGQAGGDPVHTLDVEAAMGGKSGTWRGSENGKHIVAATVPVQSGQLVVGLVRYTASLERIDDVVARIIGLTLLTAAAVVLLFLGVSLWMAKRIVKPIRELTFAARQMADGDWQRRAVPRSADEIGQLAETLNTLAAQLTRREQLKNDFISSISHELRTPLTSIKGWSETLAGDETDREELEMGLAVISQETERLHGLVEDLLDFSKLYDRSIELHPDLLDLNQPVKETVKQLGVRQEATGVLLHASVASEPLMVHGDVNRLKQVFINLIDNAYKFTPRGGSIRVTTGAVGHEAVITIADTGTGIAPDHLPHVTDKFYKGDSAKQGSGLGLAICHEIIVLHGGSMALVSELGAGTIVTIRIPLYRFPAEPETAGGG